MSKKPFRKFDEQNQKPFTERMAYKTDKLVEESLNSDLSFIKDDSYSISNLKQDWESIKLLQDDIKKTSDKLKQLGSFHTRPLSECSKLPKVEKKLKIDTSQGREIKKLQDKCEELSIIITKYEEEKQVLINTNLQLKDDLQQAFNLNSVLKKQASSSINNPLKSAEILKYGQFITKKIKEVPKWEDMFLDRISSVSNYLSMIKSQRFEDCLLETLKFLSDLMVSYTKNELSPTVPFSFSQDDENTILNCNDESENLLMTINAQSERIAKLNKQISEAVLTSKELLYSPLATVGRRDSKSQRPTCFTPNPNITKPIFSSPECWRISRESIEETSPDEEISGKPQGFGS
ncbi:hypothetical protein SteCoe_34286 [Stentor coeruleus]|uniref:Uncharacterized protein n=1 Tax=Stentor coeruleus TaxID=5963 RepID=A0A1R2AUW1_9CILI|nr:hypothetical protein SteCoe_34286 [Stentor coeruleus]